MSFPKVYGLYAFNCFSVDLMNSLLKLGGDDFTKLYGPCHAKTCLMPYANNKGADQPAHLRSLISTFFVRCLDSIMPLVSIPEISKL